MDKRCEICGAWYWDAYKHLCSDPRQLLAQERYDLVKLYAGQILAGMWANPLSDMQPDEDIAERDAKILADLIIKLHPLYSKDTGKEVG